MSKPGVNDPCPCGSVKKFKKCCKGRLASGTYAREDRASAFEKLDFFVDELCEEEEEIAHDEFWGRFLDDASELPPQLLQLSNDVLDLWFAFDHCDGDMGAPAVDLFLEQADLTAGERAFLTSLRRSTMRLYEVADIVPGSSVTLRDVVEGGAVTVNERSASRSVDRHAWLAARVVPHGPSGGPEMEAGVLHIPDLYKDRVLAQLKDERSAFLRTHPGQIDAFYKTMPPFFHEVWVGSFLDPSVPELRNSDGDETVVTRVHLDVVDDAALSRALDRHADLEPAGTGAWRWSGMNNEGKSIILGRIERTREELILETDSVERAARGRALLEALGESLLSHRVTTHENVRLAVKERVRARYLAAGSDAPQAETTGAIPRTAADALVLAYYAKHYRAWVEEPVPALDGRTPREGARDRKLRPRVVELIQGLESMYQRALRSREPAYDPSWMWSELGLFDREAARDPPPLTHERVATKVPGSDALSREVAERLRREPGFRDATSSLSQADFDRDLDVQRFLRAGRPSANDSGGEGALATPYLRLMINFDLHRRKTFWVDEALTYMLGQTDIDVLGRELRVPFASFALVFTDRHVLSLAERMLAARRDSSLAGQILKVATVYVTEEHREDARVLDVVFALDALGADLPELVRHEITLAEETRVGSYLDAVAPLPEIEPPPPDMNPVRGLLRATVNAILYATSAGVEPELRAPPKHGTRLPRGHRPTSPPAFASDEVYFLPGAIDITRVRRLQELERVPDGAVMLRRFMVRGHWRRPPENWTDRRLRWIEPYWKGPEMATIIERAYRLKE